MNHRPAEGGRHCSSGALAVVLALSAAACAGLHAEGAGTTSPEPRRMCSYARPISDRAAWEPLAATAEGRAAIGRAEGFVALPTPDCSDEKWLEFFTTGSRRAYEIPFFERTTRLEWLVLAEALEDRGRFLPDIERQLAAICDERSWVIPAHDRKKIAWEGTGPIIDLFSSARALFIARWLAVLGERLPSDLVARAKGLARARVIEPYLALCRMPLGEEDSYSETSCRWFRTKSNWGAVCHSGCAGAVLLLSTDPQERADAIAACRMGMERHLEAFRPDGYYEEGAGYWNFGFGHLIRAGLAIREATGGKVDILAGERVKTCALFAANYLLEPGLAPTFGDGTASPTALNLAYCRKVWPAAFAAVSPDLPPLGGICGGEIESSVECEWGFRAFDPPDRTDGTGGLPLRTFYPDGQVLIARLGASAPQRLAAAIKGGCNADMHNHNDLGTYVVSLDGKVVCGDPGGEWYTARTFSSRRYDSPYLSSYGHPVPRVNGCLQPAGAAYRTKIVSTSFSDDCDRVEYDMTAAYPAEAKVASLVRTLVFDRKARTITVSDRGTFTSPVSFEVPIVTYRESVFTPEKSRLFLVEDAPGVFGTYRTSFGGMSVDVAAVGGDWNWSCELLPNPLKRSARRLAVRFDRPVSAAEVSMVFSIGEECR